MEDKDYKEYLNMMCLVHIYADVQEFAYCGMVEEEEIKLRERLADRKELIKEIENEALKRVAESMLEEIDGHMKTSGGARI